MQSGSDFDISLQTHPLRSDRTNVSVAEGASLRDLGIDGKNYVAFIGGVEQQDLDYAPKAGETVLVKAVASGDNQNWRILGAIVIVAASIVTQNYVGAAYGVGWGAAAGVAVSIAGQLALNALIPLPSQNLDGDSDFSPFRRGTSNQANPFGAIPRLYGEHRIFPSLAAYPFTEQAGSDLYLQMLFCVGYGPLSIDPSSFKIGDTLLTEFDDVQYEVREGLPGDQPVTLFNRNVVETPLEVSFQFDAFSGGSNPISTATRTTVANTNAVSLDFFAPALASINSKGYTQSTATGFTIEFKPSGSSIWTVASLAHAEVSGDGGYSPVFPAGGVIAHRTKGIGFTKSGGLPGDPNADSWIVDPSYEAPAFYIRGSDVKPYQMSVKLNLPSSGSYDIRVTRYRAFRFPQDEASVYPVDEPNDAYTEFQWKVIRSFGDDAAQDLPEGLAFIALRIKMTDQLGGAINDFSCVAKGLIPAWNGSTWVTQFTSNPAYIYRHILTGSANGRPLATSRIDDATIKAWGAECVAAGREFNGVFDGRTTVFDALSSVASAGRASFQIRDGLYSVVRDKAGLSPVQMFTPRNSWDFSGSKVFAKQPHALKVKYKNRENSWQDAERIVYSDGYSESGGSGLQVATEFDTVTLFGVTSEAQAWRDGRYHLAVAKYRPETFTFTVGVEHLICQRGDVVEVQHDAMLVGIGAGRILAIAGSTITIDEKFEFESGKSYQIRIRKADKSLVTVALTNGAGITNILSLSGGVPAGVQIDNQVAVGQTAQMTTQMLVTAIEPISDLCARITAVDYATAVYTADSGAFVPGDGGISDPQTTPPAPVFLNILAGPEAAIRGNDGTLIPRIVASYIFPSSPVQVLNVDAAYRLNNEPSFVTVPSAPNSGSYVFQIPAANSDYVIRIRGVSATGVPGPWAEIFVAANDAVPEPLGGITLQEQTNSPATPNGDLSTVIATVAPPAGATNYSHSLVDYRRVSSASWFVAGPTDVDGKAYVVLNSDGSTYEFRARAVSTAGYEDSSGPTAQITLSIAAGEVPDPDMGANPLPALNVQNLRLYGEPVGQNEFSGTSPRFQWDPVTPPAGKTIKDYRVEIYDPTTNLLMSRYYTVQADYTYSLAQNTNDAAENGYAYPLREFRVEVVARTVQGDISAAPATKTVINPPPVLPGDFTITAFYTQIEITFSRPVDPDFTQTEVFMSPTPGFIPGSANRVYSGYETSPIDILNVLDGVTYYIRVRLWDVFGPGGMSIQYETATAALPGNDNEPPSPITGLTLTSSVQSAELYTLASITATWDISTDNSGSLFYEIEYYTSSSSQTTVASTPHPSFSIYPADAGTAYNVRVRAVDYTGNASEWTAYASITAAVDTVAPGAITSATATAGLDKVTLKWTNPTDADFLQTRIYRGTTSGFTPAVGNLIATTRATAWIDADVVNGTSYYYKFAAVDVAGNQGAISAAVGPASPFKITSTNISTYVADAALTTAKFAAGIEPVTIIAGTVVPATKSTNAIYVDGKLYRWSGTAYVATVEAADLAGQITGTQISDNAITTPKIAANAVTATQIAAGTITAAEIATDTITAGNIAAGAISTSELAAGAVTAAKIAAGTITANEIAASTITSALIAADAITADKIATNAVDADAIAANAITSAAIQAGAVTADKLTVAQLSAISANMGSITSGTITGAVIRTAASGARVQLDSVNGIVTYNSSGQATAQLNLNGAGFLGLNPGFIQWNTAGQITFNGSVTATGTILGPLFKTTGTWSVEVGAQTLNLDGDGNNVYVMTYRNGSSSRFRMDQTGNIRIQGDIKTASSGQRVHLDASTNTVNFYDSSNILRACLGYTSSGGNLYALMAQNNQTDSYGGLVLGQRIGLVGQSNTGIANSAGVWGIGDVGVQGQGSYGVCGSGTLGPLQLAPSLSASAPTHYARAGSFWACDSDNDGNDYELWFQSWNNGVGVGNFWKRVQLA